MYIRTEDGVYEVVEFDEECIIPSMLIKVKNYGKERITHCCKSDIIKQADTIEELCDEFVYIEYKNPRVLDRVITREIKEKGIKVAETIYCHPNWNGLMYGAIWTDKGLIYVAKMDSEGKLVLI